MPKHTFWILLLSVACSSDATIEETYAYSDNAGRSCQATLEKARPGSPSVGQSVSCDGATKDCSAETTPCFVLSVDDETFDIRSCPACCIGKSHSFADAECAVVVCETDADCVYAEGKCLSGLCSCPDGVCE